MGEWAVSKTDQIKEWDIHVESSIIILKIYK